jgi:hypothetical protein
MSDPFPSTRPSGRKLIAAVGLLTGLALWVIAALAIATRLLPDHWLADLVFYSVAGVGWVVWAARLVRWSARG